MAFYPDTFQDMVNRLRKQRPSLDPFLARDFLNDRLRTLLDRRPQWSGLLQRGVLAIPQAYVAGTISLTTGSPAVVGTNTSWPVSDVVNTVIVDMVIAAPSAAWVTLANMTGVNQDTVLYVDAAGPNPEICPVQQIIGSRVLLQFAYPHAAGVTATASSLNGLQMRVGTTNPIYTVQAITSPTSLITDNAWGNYSMSGASYQLIKMYTTFGVNMKDLIVVTDPVQQIKLRLHVSQGEINLYDPNRTATDSPTSIADLGPNANGQQLYEIYPPQSTPRALYWMGHIQWPKMVAPWDRPPSGINPTVLVYGALASAFRTPIPIPPEGKDPGFSLEASQVWEALFETTYADNCGADESLYQAAYMFNYAQVFSFGMGANFLQAHDMDALTANW